MFGRSEREEAEYRRFRYSGSDTLINRFDIRDPARLEAVERAVADRRLKQPLPQAARRMTYGGFKAIHRHLFQDVYDWAGQERTYTTGRGAAPFATPENIRPWMEMQFQRLGELNLLRGAAPQAFAEHAAELVNEINAAHPFIEGNGRTQRTWLRLLGARAGYRITLRTEDRAAWYDASRRGFEHSDHAPMARLIISRMAG